MRRSRYRVEVLGKGNQFFAFGIHPESGQPLKWSVSPEDVDRDDLPTLTDEQVKDILEFAGNLIGATRKTFRAFDEPMPVRDPTGDEWPIGDIRDALAMIPNSYTDYDWWFKITSATYDACNGNGGGCQEWLSWSHQYPNFSYAEADKLWRALNTSPPTTQQEPCCMRHAYVIHIGIGLRVLVLHLSTLEGLRL